MNTPSDPVKVHKDFIHKRESLSTVALERLKRAEARRVNRYKNSRCVYSYFREGCTTMSDNLILLPFDTKKVHKDFLIKQYSLLGEDVIKRMSSDGIVIKYIGDFDVAKFEFVRRSPSVLIDFKSLSEMLHKVSNK